MLLNNVFFLLLVAKIADVCSTSIIANKRAYVDPKYYNFVAKKIFQDTDLLLKFINGAKCPDCENPNHYKSITHVGEVQNPDTRSWEEIAFDVACLSNTGNKTIVEIRVVKEKYSCFGERSQYYVSRLIHDQLSSLNKRVLHTDQEYALLKPVHFIAILDFSLFPGDEFISNHLMLDKKTHANHLNLSTYTFIELPKLKKAGYDVEKYETFIAKMSYLFWFQRSEKKYTDCLVELFKRDPDIQRAANYANPAHWNSEEEAEYRAIQDTDDLFEDVMNTCHLEALEQGHVKGYDQTFKSGCIKGDEKGSKQIAEKLIKIKKLSDAEIAECTSMKEPEIEAMRKQWEAKKTYGSF
ncbi:uncharacterized protein LOC135845730 [Planococcus citri]|uniref:uncharacterized protein LOC135845730 n=1 Tax=Planococcus citri TaxID=170843 RepID=UPI0031FA43D6